MGRRQLRPPTSKVWKMQQTRLDRYCFCLGSDSSSVGVPPGFGCAALSTSRATHTSVSRVLRSCPASVKRPEWMRLPATRARFDEPVWVHGRPSSGPGRPTPPWHLRSAPEGTRRPGRTRRADDRAIVRRVSKHPYTKRPHRGAGVNSLGTRMSKSLSSNILGCHRPQMA